MTRVTPSDCLAVGLCLSGQRRFLTKHGFDFKEFVTEGIEVSRFEGIDDFNLRRALDHAAARETDNGE